MEDGVITCNKYILASQTMNEWQVWFLRLDKDDLCVLTTVKRREWVWGQQQLVSGDHHQLPSLSVSLLPSLINECEVELTIFSESRKYYHQHQHWVVVTSSQWYLILTNQSSPAESELVIISVSNTSILHQNSWYQVNICCGPWRTINICSRYSLIHINKASSAPLPLI